MEDLMSAKKPKVSVLVQTYNRPHYVCEAIDSVLAQTFKDYEIIVIDGSESDETRKVLNKYGDRIRYVHHDNLDMAATRNLGVRQAAGELIAILEDDDLFMPQKLEKQVALLDNDHSLAFVVSDTYAIDADGVVLRKIIVSKKNTRGFDGLIQRNFIQIASILLRKKHLEEAGLFDENLKIADDWDMWLRLAKKYRFLYHEEPLSKRRIHAQNSSHRYDDMLQAGLTTIRKKEITRGMTLMKKRICLSEVYYVYANKYFEDGQYLKSGILFFKSVVACPIIGKFHWPKDSKKMKFSLIYRILRPYLLMSVSLIKLAFQSKGANKGNH